MRLIETYRDGGSIRQREISWLGPYDERKFEATCEIARSYKRLRNAKFVIEDIEDIGAQFQGKGYFRSFRRY